MTLRRFVTSPISVVPSHPDLARLGSDRRIPQGAGTHNPQQLRPRVLGTIGMGVREIGGVELPECTGIGVHHSREPPILGSENLADGSTIDLRSAEAWQERARGDEEGRATVHEGAVIIYLDTHMLHRVYSKYGICVRNHCGAEPPRDIEPPCLLPKVDGRDPASTD